MNRLIIFIALLLFSVETYAQDDIGSSARNWYSLYISKKISPKWSIENYSLFASKNLSNEFWLGQVQLSATYRFDRYISLQGGYSFSIYKHSDWWESHYEQDPIFSDFIGFHALLTELKYKIPINSWLLWDQRLGSKFYIPAFEKYQLRAYYTTRLSTQAFHKNLQSKFYIQGTLYYFHNGRISPEFTPFQNGTSGFHRYRLKANLSFRPIKELRKVKLNIYYMINREFNLGNGVNGLNRTVTNLETSNTTTLIPFNNYNTFGMQVNVFI